MKFSATTDQIVQLVTNAINASIPMGNGIIAYRPIVYTTDDIESSVFNIMDVDYFAGRMVKLYIEREEGSISHHTKEPSQMQGFYSIEEPRMDYQSWQGTYSNARELLNSVSGIVVQM